MKTQGDKEKRHGNNRLSPEGIQIHGFIDNIEQSTIVNPLLTDQLYLVYMAKISI